MPLQVTANSIVGFLHIEGFAFFKEILVHDIWDTLYVPTFTNALV